MRCWTKRASEAKGGYQYTTCDGNQGKKSNTKSRKKRRQRRPATPQLGDDTHEMPSSRPVVSKQVNNLFVSLPSLTGIVGNVASLLNMKSDAEMSSFVKKKSRPPTSFNEFGDDAEFRSRVDVAPRTMGTRATRIPSPEIFKDTRDEWNADMPSEEVRGMEGFKDYQESTDYSSSDDDEEETKVTKFEFEGVLYYRDEDNVLYNPETSEIVGRLEGGSIDFTYGDDPDYESSEDEEVITGDIADLNEEEITDDEEAPDPFVGKFNNIMGRSLTGLTPAQMNALDPAVLFGMLPTHVSSQVVLNPQRTGVRVAPFIGYLVELYRNSGKNATYVITGVRKNGDYILQGRPTDASIARGFKKYLSPAKLTEMRNTRQSKHNPLMRAEVRQNNQTAPLRFKGDRGPEGQIGDEGVRTYNRQGVVQNSAQLAGTFVDVLKEMGILLSVEPNVIHTEEFKITDQSGNDYYFDFSYSTYDFIHMFHVKRMFDEGGPRNYGSSGRAPLPNGGVIYNRIKSGIPLITFPQMILQKRPLETSTANDPINGFIPAYAVTKEGLEFIDADTETRGMTEFGDVDIFGRRPTILD